MLPGRLCLIFTDSWTSPCTSSLCGIFHGGSVLLLYSWTLHSRCFVSCTILRGLDLLVVVVIEDNDVSLYIFFLLSTFIDLILNKCYEKKKIMMWSVMLLLFYSFTSQSTCSVRDTILEVFFFSRAKRFLCMQIVLISQIWNWYMAVRYYNKPTSATRSTTLLLLCRTAQDTSATPGPPMRTL